MALRRDTATVTVPGGAAVTRVEIDAERAFPDVDRETTACVRLPQLAVVAAP